MNIPHIYLLGWCRKLLPFRVLIPSQNSINCLKRHHLAEPRVRSKDLVNDICGASMYLLNEKISVGGWKLGWSEIEVTSGLAQQRVEQLDVISLEAWCLSSPIRLKFSASAHQLRAEFSYETSLIEFIVLSHEHQGSSV